MGQRWYRLLEHSPRLYTYNLRKRQPRRRVVTAETEFVIVGYPACANTFARVAFLHANPGVTVASHAHSWTQVAEAKRRGLPALILVREPIAAVSSMLVRFGENTSVKRELKAFAHLYRRTVPYLDDAIVADFGEVTSRFGDVIQRFNQRFATSFTPFAHDDPNATAAVFAAIDAFDRTQFGDATRTRTARPSREKDEEKARIRPLLDTPEVRPLLEECDQLYRTFLRHAQL